MIHPGAGELGIPEGYGQSEHQRVFTTQFTTATHWRSPECVCWAWLHIAGSSQVEKGMLPSKPRRSVCPQRGGAGGSFPGRLTKGCAVSLAPLLPVEAAQESAQSESVLLTGFASDQQPLRFPSPPSCTALFESTF